MNPQNSPRASLAHTYTPPSEGINAVNSDTVMHIGNAHIIGKTHNITIESPGPLLDIVSSIPKAPAATRQ